MENKALFSFNFNVTGIIIIIAILLGVYFYFNKMSDKDVEILSLKQNLLAEQNKVALLKKDSTEMYHKYASVVDLNDSLNSVLTERDEEVKQLTKVNLELKEFISNNQGHYDSTVIVDTVCYGISALFNYDGDVYSYKAKAIIDEHPVLDLAFKIKPFSLNIYATQRKSDNIYSGYAEIFPVEFRDYLSVNDMQVFIDEDEFTNKNKVSTMKFTILGSLISPDVKLFGGLNVLLKGKYTVGYSHSIGGNNHLLQFGYTL